MAKPCKICGRTRPPHRKFAHKTEKTMKRFAKRQKGK